MLEKCKHLFDNEYNIGVLFMDLSKAFDAYGFCLKFTTFIQSYLNKTMQKVNANNKFSAWEDIYSGVPQDSIFSPLTLIIFSLMTFSAS